MVASADAPQDLFTASKLPDCTNLTEDSEIQLLFPNLESLVLEDVDFRGNTNFSDGLVQVFKLRSEHGVSLEVLKIIACSNVSKSTEISNLETVVTTVDWDPDDGGRWTEASESGSESERCDNCGHPLY